MALPGKISTLEKYIGLRSGGLVALRRSIRCFRIEGVLP